ncbi:MAG: unsaturated chondroitin disaccharide hydrolase [Frankiales bacterium]|jgi:unsaturated chondroitin disaccharide hydrolase|nr:unsaturated chondroitin disaccharide hydrolase [Frankiales bacterium]
MRALPRHRPKTIAAGLAAAVLLGVTFTQTGDGTAVRAAAAVGDAIPAVVDPVALDASLNATVGLAHWRLLDMTRTVGRGQYPYLGNPDGSWTTGVGWTGGFFPGALWYSAEQSADPTTSAQAAAWTLPLAAQRLNKGTHDVGFLIMSSFGNGFRLTGNPAYSSVVVQAAASLATRYSAVVGATRSWNDPSNFIVIIDNMMNLELLDYAAGLKGGSPIWRDMALAHSLTTARTLVHSDGSVVQEALFDPTTGALRQTSNASVNLGSKDVWARGQAWALNGFATQYRYLRDPRLLDTARSVADYFLAHLPADAVPHWNLNDKTESTVPDTSAAAIAASGLATLAFSDPDPAHQATYRAGAARLLAALTSPANLDTTVTGAGVLKHASQLWNGPQSDTSLIYADYYLLEAIERFRLLPSTLTPLQVVGIAASSAKAGTPASAAFDGSRATGWSAQGSGQWIRADLGPTAPVVSEASVTWSSGTTRSQRFIIETSLDGLRWSPAYSGASSGLTSGPERYGFRQRPARYVRVRGLGNTLNTWNGVAELSVA